MKTVPALRGSKVVLAATGVIGGIALAVAGCSAAANSNPALNLNPALLPAPHSSISLPATPDSRASAIPSALA